MFKKNKLKITFIKKNFFLKKKNFLKNQKNKKYFEMKFNSNFFKTLNKQCFYFDKIEKYQKEKKNMYFIKIQLTNKLMPDIYLVKNMQKIKTLTLKTTKAYKRIFLNEMNSFYFWSDIFNMDIFFFINHRFIFFFIKNIYNFFYNTKKKLNIYIKIYKKKKPIRFIRKQPKLKKKYRKINRSNSILNI